MAETKKKAEASPEKAADKGNEEVQKTADQEVDQGFRGTEVDTTPNEHYTLAGVVEGKPVPEASRNPHQARLEAMSEESKGLPAEDK